MPTPRERFFERESFVVIGHDSLHPFPRISFSALKNQGKKLFPVDPDLAEVEGIPVLRELSELPMSVEAAIIEVPAEETEQQVQRVLDAGIRVIWIHMGTETRQAFELARSQGAEVWTGGCAAMYTVPNPSYHMIHRFIVKLLGKY